MIASKARKEQMHDDRFLTANANQLNQIHSDWHHSTTPQQKHEPSNVVENKKVHQNVASTIISKLRKLREVVKCDPLAESEESLRLKNHHRREESVNSSTNDEKEFGILSSTCGVGRKCHEGVCIDAEEWNFQNHHRQRTLQEQPDDADIVNTNPADGDQVGIANVAENTQVNGTGFEADIPQGSEVRPDAGSTIVDTMQYACDYGGLVGYDCVCNFNTSSSYTGNATCIVPLKCTSNPSVCNVNITDCYQTSYSVNLQGTPGVWDAELCLTFLEPYEQTVCYQTFTEDFGENVMPDCNISLDGQQCSNCEVYKFGDGNCYEFDCGNTPFSGNGRGSMTGNTCDSPAHSVYLYLKTYGCPSCDLCKEGKVMSSPANPVEIFSELYQCAYVQDIASQGYFTVESCNYFSDLAQEPCGCAGESDGMVGVNSPTNTNETDATVGNSTSTESPTQVLITNDTACNICPNGISNPNGTIVFPGSKEISCSEIEAAGMDGSVVGEELCLAVQSQAAVPCCGVPKDVVDFFQGEDVMDSTDEDACTICGPGMTHSDDSQFVSVPTQGIFSCRDLIEMGKDGTLDNNGICLLVQLAAKTACGCVADGPTLAPTRGKSEDEVVEDAPTDSGATRTLFGAVLTTVASALVASCLFW